MNFVSKKTSETPSEIKSSSPKLPQTLKVVYGLEEWLVKLQ